MVGIPYFAFGATALQLVSATAVAEDWPLHLIKRQEPGTNSYNCHDNCGQAIIGSRSTGYCTNNAFTSNYANCLQCAGPDNEDIWLYYGTTLTRAATSCGLSTTPLSGAQAEVPVAIPAAGGSVTPSSTSSNSGVAPMPTPTSGTTTALEPTTDAPTSTEPTAIPAEETSVSSTAAPTTAPSSSSSAPTANTSATSVAASAASTTSAVKPSIAVSGAPQGTGSATVPTGTVPFTGAASSLLPNAVAFFGVAAIMAVGIGA
ncbi:hypothetical protein BJ875DRAFT_448891 [Amylocarpus encephaloides]|uniref:WSC domain-containing protein n=1 Tax=Amylocarpus encephaloides TaxID=45428 RepID=A0A9P8CA91_9HELO|nr:hypothetical protein BJ875DRAFT_448891 [Amylocarpus encephaloides]